MENAAEALKLAFYAMLFVIAISLSISMFTLARQTSDIVLRSADETEYYDYIEYTDADTTGNRIVGLETIIPTLYKYSKERYKVTFAKGDYNSSTGEVSNLQPLEIYKSTTNSANTSICSFDITEETQRAEPWVGSTDEIKKHLDAVIGSTKYYLPQYTDRYIDYSVEGSFSTLAGKKFVELIGRINTASSAVSTTTKMVITYVLIN